MNEDAFRRFMKRDGRSESTIQESLTSLHSFAEYMNKTGHSIHAATEKDLEEFASKIADERVIRNMMHSLRYCFQFMENQGLTRKSIEIRGRYLKRTPFKLKDFVGIPTEVISKLKGAGLHNIYQLLGAGSTDMLRRDLSQQLDIPLHVIVELVKMCDLARIFGLKAIRARLYHDSGVDTIDKMSSMNPEELIQLTRSYIKKNNFNGIPPTPKEAEYTIKEAKSASRIVEW
jgi:hypothetical protein